MRQGYGIDESGVLATLGAVGTQAGQVGAQLDKLGGDTVSVSGAFGTNPASEGLERLLANALELAQTMGTRLEGSMMRKSMAVRDATAQFVSGDAEMAKKATLTAARVIDPSADSLFIDPRLTF